MRKKLFDLLDYGIAALVVKNGKYLLLKNSKKAMFGHWAPPHGVCESVDKCEENCVIREVLEKSNLDVKPIKKLWTTKADTMVKTVSFWLVKVINGEIKINKRKSSDYGWFALGEVMKLKLFPATKRFFSLVKENKIKI